MGALPKLTRRGKPTVSGVTRRSGNPERGRRSRSRDARRCDLRRPHGCGFAAAHRTTIACGIGLRRRALGRRCPSACFALGSEYRERGTRWSRRSTTAMKPAELPSSAKGLNRSPRLQTFNCAIKPHLPLHLREQRAEQICGSTQTNRSEMLRLGRSTSLSSPGFLHLHRSLVL